LGHALSVAGLELSGAISERNAARHELRTKSWEVVYVEVEGYGQTGPSLPAVDGTCHLDSNWVRIHNLACSDGVSKTPTSPSSADKGASRTSSAKTQPGR
jgi:hypothetical protein